LRDKFVSAWDAVISAFETTAPDSSVTVPTSEPYKDWAEATQAKPSTYMVRTAKNIPDRFCMAPTLSDLAFGVKSVFVVHYLHDWGRIVIKALVAIVYFHAEDRLSLFGGILLELLFGLRRIVIAPKPLQYSR